MRPTASTAPDDGLADRDRVYLEKQRRAADIILELAEDNMISAALEAELYIFRDLIDHALLVPGAAGEILPWLEPPAPRLVPSPDAPGPSRA